MTSWNAHLGRNGQNLLPWAGRRQLQCIPVKSPWDKCRQITGYGDSNTIRGTAWFFKMATKSCWSFEQNTVQSSLDLEGPCISRRFSTHYISVQSEIWAQIIANRIWLIWMSNGTCASYQDAMDCLQHHRMDLWAPTTKCQRPPKMPPQISQKFPSKQYHFCRELHLDLCYSKCGPWTINTGITWELISL